MVITDSYKRLQIQVLILEISSYVIVDSTTGDPFEITLLGLQEITTRRFQTSNESLLEKRIGGSHIRVIHSVTS